MNVWTRESVTPVILAILLTMTFFPSHAVGISSSLSAMGGGLSTSRNTSAAQDEVTPLRRATFVASNPESLVDDFAFMAAVPTSTFAYGGHTYVSPLVYYTESESERWLIDDWVEYLGPDGGVSQAVIVGDMQESSVLNLQQVLGSIVYPRIEGNSSAEIAAKLALMDWRTSDVAVFAIANDTLGLPRVVTGSVSHTFVNNPTTTQTQSVSVSTKDPVYVPFTPPSGAGWLEGSFNWTGDEIFTHVLLDPYDAPVDYSVIAQTYMERLVSNPVPLYFWVPKSADGEWNVILRPVSITDTISVDCEIKYHAGFTQAISVPSSARWLNVTIDWNNAATDLNLALIDPAGRLGQWAPAGSILSNPGRESISLPYPMAGNWTAVVAWMDSTTESNDVLLSWSVVSLPESLQAYLESAANGAVLASLLNAPLLYVTDDTVPEVTQWAVDRLGVNVSFLVDPNNIHSSTLTDALGLFSFVQDLNNYPLVSSWIKAVSGRSDVVVTVPTGTGNELFAPAALSGAVHGAPVFSLCGDDNTLTTRAEETWAPYLVGPEIDVYITSRYTTRTENGWYDERIPNRYSMAESADAFQQFLEDRNAFNATSSQSVVIVSPVDNIKVSFDRSLQCHFSPGRIPATESPAASVMISRAALHRFIFRTADSANQALLTMYAYTDGATYPDNYLNSHVIQQYDDSVSALESAGFTIASHVGYSEVFSVLSSQPGFWSMSTHGTITRLPTDPPERPGGLGIFSMRDADAPYGFEVSVAERESTTDSDQIVNPVAFQAEAVHHVMKTTGELEQAIGSLGSPIVILTACLLGGSELPLMLMEHGAVSVIASPRTVYFLPAGLVCVLMTQAIAAGNTTGSALTESLKTVSYDYSDPPSGDPRDYANQHVLFGDPEIRLYDTVSHPRVTSVNPMNTTFGNHVPGRGVAAVAALGVSSYLPDSLLVLGVDSDYYESTNYSDFISLLPLRRVVIVEPGSLGTLESVMAASASKLDDYVRSGGILVLLGVSGDIEWLPWSVSLNESNSGPSIVISDPTHPFMSVPNELADSTGFQGHFDSVWANLSVLATDGSDPVVVAGVVGTGKLCLTTTTPAGPEQTATVENAVTWGEQPSLVLKRVTLNEYVIWEGDRVVVTLEIADLIGTGTEDVTVRVWLGPYQLAVDEVGGGAYTVTLDEQWTSNRTGTYDLRVNAMKAGHDTLSLLLVDFMYIRPSPWLAIGVVAAVAGVLVVGALYIRHRKGGKLFSESRPRRSSEKQVDRAKEERARQKERDEKVDPSEFFGV